MKWKSRRSNVVHTYGVLAMEIAAALASREFRRFRTVIAPKTSPEPSSLAISTRGTRKRLFSNF